MELTFLVGRDGQNVKRPRRACTSCRQKKKRCFHGSSAGSNHQSYARLPDPLSSPVEEDSMQKATLATSDGLAGRDLSPQLDGQEAQNSPGVSTTHSDKVRREFDTPRFLCYTSPLVALQNNPQPPQLRLPSGQVREGDVGAWSYEENNTPKESGPQRSPTPRQHGNSGILPPRESQVALMEIFFSRIHPLLPVVDEDDTHAQFQNGTLPHPLLQAICLVAAKDRSATPFLLLGSDATLLPINNFGQRLYKDILVNIPHRRDGNRLLIIRILALLSLHEWGRNGSEESSLTLTQAIHHAWSIGLHLRRADSETAPKAQSLFWCLWSLDKWSSVVEGRPVLIHDCDHGQKVTDVLPLFKPPQRIWLLIADQLGRVIRTYRPRLEGAQDQFPDLSLFEEFVEISQGWDTEPLLLDSLELYYHATIILGTYSAELQGRQPSRESKIHQSQAILALAATCRRNDIREFSPLPISAYSISLAFSITYKQLQKAKLTSHQLLARDNLSIFHQSLKSISNIWWLAAVMMRLGRQALENSQPPATQRQSGPQLPTSRLNEVSRSRSSLDQYPILSNVNSSTSQPDTSDFDNHGASQGSLNTLEDPLSGTLAWSGLDHHPSENWDLSTLGEDSLETIFENFLDVNFPICLGEQSLGGYDTSS